MLKRKITEKLLAWKKGHGNECLLVKGARQIGKTFIIDNFGRENYASYIYLNFIRNPGLKSIFDGSLEAIDIYRNISLFLDNVKFIEGDTLIFLDEIQACPNARTALKFLALDNRYDVIASGSLLGLGYREISSVPVGYERVIEMFSLDFEEFLWALGKTPSSLLALKEHFDRREPLPEAVNSEYLGLLDMFSVVGGMPEVVNAFLETNNYREAYNVQRKILDSYSYDITNYAAASERSKIAATYLSIPRQLSKEHTKFQYKTIDPTGNSRKYATSLDWLSGAGLIKSCSNVSTPLFPLAAYERPEQFKIYMNDIGLLTAMFGFETQQALLKGTLYGPAKGGIYENLVFDLLVKRGRKPYYFKSPENDQEIEFLLNAESSIVPIEVKSRNGSTKSLNAFIEKYEPPLSYKLIRGNVGTSGGKITLPLYMGIFI